MKKRTLNKILVFTLCCIIASATVVNAKQFKQPKNSRTSAYYYVELPTDPEGSRH